MDQVMNQAIGRAKKRNRRTGQGGDKIVYHFRLTPTGSQMLKSLAQAWGTSLSAAVERAIREQYLRDKERMPELWQAKPLE